MDNILINNMNEIKEKKKRGRPKKIKIDSNIKKNNTTFNKDKKNKIIVISFDP